MYVFSQNTNTVQRVQKVDIYNKKYIQYKNCTIKSPEDIYKNS